MAKPKKAPQQKTFFPRHQSLEFEGDTYRSEPVAGTCGICGRRTHHKSVFAVEYCCSHECSRELWYQIFERILSNWMSSRKNRNHELKPVKRVNPPIITQ